MNLDILITHVLVCFVCLADPSVPNVQVTRLTLMCETAPAPLTLDLQGKYRAPVLLNGKVMLFQYLILFSLQNIKIVFIFSLLLSSCQKKINIFKLPKNVLKTLQK